MIPRRLALVALALALAGCGSGTDDDEATTGTAAGSTSTPATRSTAQPSSTPAPPAAPPVATLVAAGDVASCPSQGDEGTAALVDARPDATLAVLGDSVYERGTATEFAECYGPSWGRFKGRTRPAVGNHEYETPGATGYFDYFGTAAGARGQGYYSYDLGAWHVVALNSNCDAVSCSAGSAQERWLRADLAAHSAACTLAYWHHPRFSSGAAHGSSTAMGALWSTLHVGGADVVLAGHEHNYERFAPLGADGGVDPARGIRSFVVGTGGRSHYGFRTPALPGSEVRNSDTYGVLSLTLRSDGYDWQFVPQAGWTFTDSGTDSCH